jgi:hypothetical protein
MKDRKYFCYEIYKNLAIWSHNGRLAYNPCSFFTGFIKESDTFDLDSVWNGPERAELKRCIETDTPIAGCEVCYRAEKNGLVSRRMAGQQLYEEFHQDVNIELDSPQGLDYTVGNLCNLKCVICGPDNSSAWVSDYKKIYPLEPIEQFKYDKFNQLEMTSPELLKNIKTLHFHGGGEPLMSDSHMRLLKEVKKIKGLSDVRVFYNTNGTQRASDELLSLWEECRLVELYFSIDDVGSRFDYQRTGAKWDDVVGNLKWYQENMPHNHMFNINCAWGYLNLYYLTDIVDWHHNNFRVNRYGDPVNLIFQQVFGAFKISHLDFSVKQTLLTKFANYPQLIDLLKSIKDSDKDHSEFWSSIEKIDQVRETDYKTLCPEWSQLL